MIVYQCPECFVALPRSHWTEEGWKRTAGIECKHLFTNYRQIDLEAASTATLFTVGYAGRGIRQFLDVLEARQIELVIDTRWLPLSQHKPAFSKTRLHDALTYRFDHQTQPTDPIGYWHCKSLGSPPELRKALYATGDYEGFFTAYRGHLATQSASLWSVQALVADRQRVALLCSEAKHTECHRSVLAEEVHRLLGGKPGLVHL